MGKVFWLTGPSGAGKTTVAKAVQAITDNVVIIDGDDMRESISVGAGFSVEERRIHNMRVARLAKVLARQPLTVLVSVIAPMHEARVAASDICQAEWVYIKRTLPEREGHFYEEPENIQTLDHDKLSVEESRDKLLKIIKR